VYSRRLSISRTIKRIVFIGIGVALFLFFGLGLLARNQPVTQATAPSVRQAPWLVETTTRIYYAKDYKLEKRKPPAIRGYWELTKNQYIFHPGVLEFPTSLFGPIKVIRRQAPTK
jgi:hypothetical protein